MSATSVAERPAYFVEWLGSSGTQKIDTEYVFTTDPRVETTMMLTSNADRDVAGTSTANASCFIIDYNDAGKIIYYRYHAASYTAVTYPASILNQWVEAVWGSEVRHNGTVLKTLATQNFSDNTASFQLFYGRNGMTGRLKGVRMYDGNVLVRDFEPAVMSDGTPCMYDRVTDKCYLNSGTGTFSTGDPVFSSLTVEGSPFAVGVVSPPYGFHENELLVGTATNCSAPATVTAEGLSATCAGYRLYRWSENDADWALESSGAGNALSLAATAADARLVWLWDVAADLAVSLDGAPSAEANSATIPVFVRGLGSPASPATLKLAYGVSRDALSFTNVVSSSVTDIGALSAPLSRLSPGINYYVKAILETNGGGERAESEIVRFQTPRCEELGKPGLWQTFFTSADKNWTKDIWAVPEGTDWQNYADANRIRRRETTVIAPYTHGTAPSTCTKYVSEVWGDEVWWPVNGGQWVYAGYIYLDASKTYKFRTKIDDNERIQITDAKTGVTTTLINDTANGSGVNTSAAYTPSATGWHAIELRFSDGSGGLGGYDAANNYVNSNNLGFSQDGGSTWNLLKDPGDGSLLRLERGPSMVAEEVVANGALSSLSLSFDSSAASRTLLAAWGPAHGGNDPADWFATNAVATIAAGTTSYNWAVSSDWGSDSNLVVRFYFDGDFVEWSNATFWRDYAAPTVADVALDGTGGDTLVVSGDLVSFPGDTCTLNVSVGTTDGEPEYAWTGLAGSVRDAAGAFSLTLFEADTNAVRHLVPGETYFVTVEAVSGGQIVRTVPQEVTMKAAPIFASATSAIARRTVTFTGALADLGMNGSAVVTLYAGAESDAEEDLVAIEPAITVTDTSSFSIAHTFDSFETNYKWQFRAVATAAGGTATRETRSAAAVAKTLDTTTYTWRPTIASGNWDDPANWTNDKSDDCLGYPQTTAATAAFGANVHATIFFRRALSIGSLNFNNSGLELTFAQGGASTNATKLTANGIALAAVNGSVTLDGVAISTGGNIIIGARRALRLVNGANLHTGNLTAEAGENVISLSGGSWLSCNQPLFGGTTILIDDSTFWTRGHDYVGRTLTGGRVVFSGAHPLWRHNNAGGYFCSTLANANVQLDFLVPAGGFPEAPLQAPSNQAYIMGNNGNNAGSSAYTVNVLDESPALFADGTVTSPLISWPNKGISTSLVLGGHLPASGEGTSAAFAWDEANTPPRSLSVTITGSSHTGQLQVSGAPEAIEQSGFYPPYGFHSLSSNATVNCTAPSGLFQLSETKRATCTGWKLYAIDATHTRTLVDSGDGTSCTVTGTGLWQELEWQWKIEYLVTATAGTGGSVEPASQWCELGSWAAVTAVPDASHGFYKWSAGVPAGTRATQQTLGFVVDGPAALTASFGNVWYVSPNGDASAPNAGYATGFTTVAAGLAAAQNGDTVRVKAASYLLDDTVSLTKAVRIEGEDRDATILYKAGTAIVSYRLAYLNNADAVLSGVTISNGYANVNAGGVYIDANGGTLENCRVQQCRDNKGTAGPGIYVNSDNGVISRCILERNFGDGFSYPTGTGAYLAKGVIENSLIRANYTNRGNNDGAGINLGGTSVARNCTVVQNICSRYGGGINCGTTATAINCAIYDNVADADTSDGRPDWYGPRDRFVNCAAPVAPNASCLGGAGGFVNQASGDYRLLAGSALRNAGADVPGIGSLDLDGNPRISGGAIDIGCYEYDESSASVGLSVSPEVLFAGGTAVFTPALIGIADTAPRTWTITDEHGVATVLSASCESGVALSAPGLYTVRLDVAVPGGQTLSAEREAYLYVAPQTIYVDAASANPQSPFATPATAATDINAAAAYANLIDGSDILVADGVYPLSDQLAFERPVTLRSVNGPEATILKRFGAQKSGPRFRILYLNDRNAKVSGITLTGGSIDVGSGGGCWIGQRGGELVNCVVSNNYVSTYDSSGAGIFMNSAFAHVDRCFITCNTNGYTASAYCFGGGVKLSGGLLENCLITRNSTDHRGGGVYIEGSSKMYNCTVYGNGATKQQGGGICGYGTSITVRNCASYGNTAPQDATAGGPDIGYDTRGADNYARYANCASPKAIGSIAAIPDPAFTAPASGDFTVQSSSPLRNGGVAVADLGALDLAGDNRVQGAAPDIGCYEYDESQRAVSFTVSPTVGFAGNDFAFTPVIEGFGAGATHAWTLTDAQGNETAFGANDEAAHAIAGDGLYTVTLTVTDNGETFTAVRENYLRVVRRKYVVSTAEALHAAVDASSYIDGVEIEVADGDYILSRTIELTTATTLHSANGPTNSFLRRTYGRDGAPLFRILYINDPDAKASGFTITGGSTDVNHGGGVLIGPRGGELTWSIVSNNWVKTYDSSGGGIHMNSSRAHVDRCVITCNTNLHMGSAYCFGGGVKVSGGLLENSLITHNWTRHRGGGVYVEGSGKVYNCTVYGNEASVQQGGGICAYNTSIAVRNCASYGNVAENDATAGGPDLSYDTRGADNYACFANCASPKAIGTIAAIPDPLFTDAGGGDFTLQTGSPLIDAGAPVADLGPLDLPGNDRAYGTTAPDIGCYEYQPGAIGLNFTVSPAAGFAGDTFTFTPTIEGVEGEAVRGWSITDASGATTELPASCEEGVVLSAYGTYDVTLAVVAGGQTYTLTREALFKVAPRDLYVDAVSATPRAPYATRATAATNVIDAIAEAIDGSTIHVAPGDYEQPATIVLDNDIAVVSDAGAERTILRRAFGTAKPTFGIVQMNAPGALVKGFTITGGRDTNYGGCRILSRGGTLEDCIVEGNASTGSYADYPGGVLTSSAQAFVRRCIIRDNTMGTPGTYFGAGANINPGRIENCLITRNGSSNASSSSGGGLRLGGTAWNCTIVSNFANRATAGIVLTSDGRAVNCVILGNIAAEGSVEPDWSATLRDHLTFCASSVRTGEGYIVTTLNGAGFRNPAAGDYRLRSRSPLVNAGSDLSYGVDDTDLAGNQRIYEQGVNRHAACDIGCYEAAFNPGGGTMIILR